MYSHIKLCSPISDMISLPYHKTLILFFSFLCLRANASGNYTDHLSLLKFKQAITTDPNHILNSWNDSIPFCNWYGIRCSSRHRRVTSMMLADQKLVGSISPYIGNLSFLRIIDLQGNSLNGGIPHEVGQLFRLRRFNLTDNDIEGQIPVSIVNCSELREINLYNNKIVGNIPAEIGSLEKLQLLGLRRNNLTGNIPASIGNISALRSLDLTENKLEGSIPEDIGRLSNLSFLLIGTNRLSLMSTSIFNITSLVTISAAQNQLHGTLPDNICHTLPNLQFFGLGSNAFYGPIPKTISNCSQLKLFDIKGNNFSGQVPVDIGKLGTLSWLNLGSNNLGSRSTDDLGFLPSLTNCRNLRILAFDSNRFGGTLPKSIANLSTQLNIFYLGRNQISGTIPSGLDNLVNLIGLALQDNYFTGFIPSYFGKLQQLQLLNLEENRFSGEIPSSLGNLTQLNLLSLYDNELEGSIPSSIGNCQMLSFLDLSMNNLSGEIPTQILYLSSLSYSLNLAQNMLVGKLPPEVGKLTNLNYLDVSENNMSSEIPKTIGQCDNLEHLYLYGNSFEGIIPSTLVSLRGLRSLDLSRNNLSGQIPKDLQNLPFLENLNLSFNYLEGEVPIRGVFKNASAVSLYGNGQLCGGVSALHLLKCPYQKGKSSHSKLRIIIVTCLVVSILLLLAFVYLCCKRSSKEKSVPANLIGEHLIKVSYGDLHRATSGFSPDKLIGCGGFSSVYKGSLIQVEKPVAVKVLNLDKQGATKSFKVECRALRNIRHRNLVKVLTYCSSIDYQGNEFKALVYEFMANGSLEKWLHPTFDGGDDSGNLSILLRLNIAIDVASALHYLHDLCEIPTVHCDLKPSNVLLDDDMVAHLGDFGLARLFSTYNDHHESQSITTGYKGTIGYAAPEYGTGAVASKEGDVYSFGILLLEMFTRRRPTEEMFNEELNLHGFVKAAMPSKLMQISDPSLLPSDAIVEPDDNNGILEEEVMNNEGRREMRRNMQCLLSVLEIGLACSVESPKDRMKMMDVTRKLDLIRTDFAGTRDHNGRPGTSRQNH